MKRYNRCWALCMTMLFLIACTAWAGDRPVSSEDTPAILASLGADNVTVLDDQAAMAVRGQEYKYVLVKILGINALDGGSGINWTWNPLGYRYGAWGGPGWSNGNGDKSTADTMDWFFMQHDNAYSDPDVTKLDADKALIGALSSLATPSTGYWGPIYDPAILPNGLTTRYVQVSGLSFFGNKLFFLWKPMPYTEYARREALAAMGIMVFGRSLVSSIRF